MGKRKSKPWKINLNFFLLLAGGIVLLSLILKTLNTFQNSIFDGQNRITLVLAQPKAWEENILVFSLAPKERSISLLIIPGKTKVEVPGNFGTYPLGNVYQLGKLSLTQSKGGGELLRKTTQNFIGTPVDGWMVLNSKPENDEIRTLVKNSLSIINVLGFIKNGELGSLDTNLTIIDMLRMWFAARQVGREKIEVADLIRLNLLEEVHLLDGTSAFEADLRGLDRISASLFPEARVSLERKTVEIINGTAVAGLGGKVARIISNMGGEVLSVRTSPEKIAHSKIIVSEDSYTAGRIGKIFGFPLTREKNGEGSDILILLGED